MKYFLLSKDKSFTTAPDILNWYEDTRLLDERNLYKLEKRKILKIKGVERRVWTDVISIPNFFVSSNVRDIVEKYDRKIKFKQVILLDQENGDKKMYYLPLLEFVDCLSDKSSIKMNRIERGVLEKEKIKDKSIFRIGDVKNRYIVIRLDLAESLLRRNVRGISLEEIEVV